jgi:hypothetical protein
MALRRQRRKLILIACLAIVVVLFCAWSIQTGWYIGVPHALVPEGAQLLSRNAGDNGYWAATARNWYYEKYSVKASTAEVTAFYDKVGNKAWPFGYVNVQILPPITSTTGITQTENMRLASALRRDVTDPVGETILLIEVSWSPDQWLFGGQ